MIPDIIASHSKQIGFLELVKKNLIPMALILASAIYIGSYVFTYGRT
jgi:hypothetical protein